MANSASRAFTTLHINLYSNLVQPPVSPFLPHNSLQLVLLAFLTSGVVLALHFSMLLRKDNSFRVNYSWACHELRFTYTMELQLTTTNWGWRASRRTTRDESQVLELAASQVLARPLWQRHHPLCQPVWSIEIISYLTDLFIQPTVCYLVTTTDKVPLSVWMSVKSLDEPGRKPQREAYWQTVGPINY